MKKAIAENRFWITLAVILLIAALIITLFPQLQAEAQTGGYCTAKYVRVWDASLQRYITVKRWTCTGYTRPRRFYRYR